MGKSHASLCYDDLMTGTPKATYESGDQVSCRKINFAMIGDESVSFVSSHVDDPVWFRKKKRRWHYYSSYLRYKYQATNKTGLFIFFYHIPPFAPSRYYDDSCSNSSSSSNAHNSNSRIIKPYRTPYNVLGVAPIQPAL